MSLMIKALIIFFIMLYYFLLYAANNRDKKAQGAALRQQTLPVDYITTLVGYVTTLLDDVAVAYSQTELSATLFQKIIVMSFI